MHFRELSVVLFAILQIGDMPQGLAKSLEVYDFALTEELNRVDYVRVVREGEDIVVDRAGLLFCCDFVKTTK